MKQEKSRLLFISSILTIIAILIIIILPIQVFSLSQTDNGKPGFTLQKTFKLDLNEKNFTYEQNQFNDSSFSKLHTFQNEQNKTVWIRLPTNSTILNSTLKVSGEILLNKSRPPGDIDFHKISIGNVTTDSGKEIVVSSYGGTGPDLHFYTSKYQHKWSNDLGVDNGWDVEINNISLQSQGNEVLASSESGLHLFNGSGYSIWNNSLADIRSISVTNITQDIGKEIIAGGPHLWLLNSTGQEIGKKTLENSTWAVAGGDVKTSNNVNEIVYGTRDGNLNLLNYTGGTFNETCSHSIGQEIKSVDVGNLTDDQGMEIAVVDSSGNVYIFNSSCHEMFISMVGSNANDVKIGEFVNSSEGKELGVALEGGAVYVLNSSLGEIDNFQLDDAVRGVDIGNVIETSGFNKNELLSVTMNGTIYRIDYDAFPTNLTLKIGNNITWNYREGDGRLRSSKIINDTNSNMSEAFQDYLDNATGSQFSEIPATTILFSSEYRGNLNISNLNITYRYDASPNIHNNTIYYWSRTENTRVNESIVNQTINISFTPPAVDINITSIKINSSATECGLKNKTYSNFTENGKNYCDISAEGLMVYNETGHDPIYLWHNNLESSIPIIMNTSEPSTSNSTNNYRWYKNLTIWNQTPLEETFRNITANTTINDTVIVEKDFLNVSWNGTTCDITPSIKGSCKNPTEYTSMNCSGDTFYVCKNDTDGNGVVDFFKWKQPHTSKTDYLVGGSTNHEPILSNPNVTPKEDIWGSNFTFEVNISDADNDTVNVTLYAYLNKTLKWQEFGTQNVSTDTGEKNISFDVTSNKNWTGKNKYKFEYTDYNDTDIFHRYNTSKFSNPNCTKHSISFVNIVGNNTKVNRTEDGTEYILLGARINDTDLNKSVNESVNTTFWITTNSSDWDSGHYESTNSSGHVNLTFTPDSRYLVGSQWWKLGVMNSEFYNSTNSSTNYSLEVHGKLSIDITKPREGETIYRNSSKYLEAKIVDQFNNTVDIEGYNCTFWRNNSLITNNSITNASGYCNHTWGSDCSLSRGHQNINTTLWGNASSFYTIEINNDMNSVVMKDELNLTIDNPSTGDIYHKTNTLDLNSTVNDTCLNCSNEDYNVTWYLNWNKKLKLNLTEDSGLERSREPYTLNGSYLKGLGFDINNLKINKTKVITNGEKVPLEVRPWTNESKVKTNYSQTYFDNLTEIVFLTNFNPRESKIYWILWNETNPQPQNNLSFIKNGGIESGDLNFWNYTNITYNPDPDTGSIYYSHSVENKSENQNYSVYLLANTDTVFLNQTLTKSMNSTHLKMKYKAWGDYSDPEYVKIITENEECNLNLQLDSVPETDANWTEIMCNFSSPSKSNKDISIAVRDEVNNGYGKDASHLLMDYICIANSTGDCVNPHSGAPLQRDLKFKNQIKKGHDVNWTIPADTNVGERRILANSSGKFYKSDVKYNDLIFYGWSNITEINLSSDDCNCLYNGTDWICGANTSIKMYCSVFDANSSKPIQNYDVKFWNDTSFMRTNQTNSRGKGIYWFNTSERGKYNISCNITDQASVFYNNTKFNSKNMSFFVRSNSTRGRLLQEPNMTNATNITSINNDSFPVNITLENIGNGNMYSLQVIVDSPEGFITSDVTCPNLGIGETCNRSIQVDVNQTAEIKDHIVNVTVEWTNGDGTIDNVTNNTYVSVKNNTVLNITENQIKSSNSAGFEGTLTNFTVEAFGNTKIENINFTFSGKNASSVRNWTTLNPPQISTILKAQTNVTIINGSIPPKAEPGTYLANITANATGSTCYPEKEKCWDTTLLNLSISKPDWNRYPNKMNKTIGSSELNGTIGDLTIENNLDKNQTFNLTLTNYNDTQYIYLSKSLVNVSNQSTETVKVFHNKSTYLYEVGTWLSNITINNMDNSSVPSDMTTSVSLKVVNLTIDILEPNRTYPAGPLNISDNITIRANVTKPGEIVNESVSFEAVVGGVNCSNITDPEYINISKGWKFICEAPKIPGNPINNSLKVKAKDLNENISSLKEKENLVKYYDVTPPHFSKVKVESVNQNNNVDTIPIEVNITDNKGIDKVWMNISYDNGTEDVFVRLDSNNYSNPGNGSLYNFSFSNPNVISDYDITVYANDTKNETGVSRYGGQVNNTTGWFDVYKPVDMMGNLTNADGKNISANFTFYRVNTSFPIHQRSTNLSSGVFNWTLHKRKYDLEIEIFGHTIRFESLDTNKSTILQYNETADNFTKPFRFDEIPNSSVNDIGNIILPDKAEKPVLGVTFDTFNLSYKLANVTLDYSDALETRNYQQGDFEIFKCSEWDFSDRTCNGTFGWLGRSLDPNVGSNIFRFEVSHNTTYAIAESCWPNICGQSPEGTEKPGTSGPTSPAGSIEEEGEEKEEPFPFELETNLQTSKIFRGSTKNYWLMITNKLNKNITASISLTGKISDWIDLEKESVYLNGTESKTISLSLSVPPTTKPGTYSGNMVVEGKGKQKTLPVQVIVKKSGKKLLSIKINIIDRVITTNEDLDVQVKLKSVGDKNKFNTSLTYLIKNSKNKTVKEIKDRVEFEDTYSTVKEIPIKKEKIKPGEYILEVWAGFDNRAVKDMQNFQITQPFWASTAGQLLLFLGIPIALIVMIIGGFFLRKQYLEWRESKEEEQRYLFPVDESKIPQNKEDSFWIGKLAGSDKKAFYNPRDLKTHVLVAGATGAGKSVGASIFVEEALNQDIPVVVFDPTAQWTGFVKSCKDEELLKYYNHFNMEKSRRRSYPGLIYEMSDPEKEVNFKELMKPGEITVFTLNNLKVDEFDDAVRNIIDSIFDIDWEESEDLELIVVFDEVHRLLEKYGGKGGYKALERGAREFRKWGIGLVMCSQVLTDFKEAVAGNVLTDAQFNTKAMKDIKKAKNKYGEKYAKRITRQGIGVCMMQHPQYNDGNPWFVRFRPTWHNPHKLKDEDLEKYKEFTSKLEEIEKKIEGMKERGEDTFDLETSLRMARDKLKSGNFRMAEIYIDSLEDKL